MEPDVDFQRLLGRLLQIGKQDYDYVLARLGDPISLEDVATAEVHHVRHDGNGAPRFYDLVEVLFSHLINFVVKPSEFPAQPDAQAWMRLGQAARDVLRRDKNAGTFGELLLFFLMETVARAPQIVSKYSYKQNRRVEILGADGVHARWDPAANTLDLFLGEAKIYADAPAAIRKAFADIEAYHKNEDQRYEIRLLSRNYKHDDPNVAAALDAYLGHKASRQLRINHAVLIGYDWAGYAKKRQGLQAAIEQEVRVELQAHFPQLRAAIEDRLGEFSFKQLRFLIFLVPFDSVEQIRARFLKMVAGQS